MSTKANVHLLAVSSSNTLKSDRKHIVVKDNKIYNPYKNEYYHLYITLPQSGLEISKIKKGDWFITDDNSLKSNNPNLVIKQCKEIINSWIMDDEGIGHSPDNCEKIIATTDESLWRNTDFNSIIIPSIPSQFIEHCISEYNKRNIIKQIEVELKESKLLRGNIPSIYSKQILKLNQQNEISIIMNKSD